MWVKFLKTVGLLLNFLVAFEANQGVTLNGAIYGTDFKLYNHLNVQVSRAVRLAINK